MEYGWVVARTTLPWPSPPTIGWGPLTVPKKVVSTVAAWRPIMSSARGIRRHMALFCHRLRGTLASKET